MTISHDSAASLRVEYRECTQIWPSTLRHGALNGWYVIRTCPCHEGVRITMPFESRERAEKALRALDEDARRHAA